MIGSIVIASLRPLSCKPCADWSSGMAFADLERGQRRGHTRERAAMVAVRGNLPASRAVVSRYRRGRPWRSRRYYGASGLPRVARRQCALAVAVLSVAAEGARLRRQRLL